MFSSWQILKCNLKFVPVSNLIESPLHRLPRVHWGTIKILLRLQLKNISDQRMELFHFFFPKLDPDSYYDDNFKIFSVLVWNLKSKNERNLIFSAGNKNTDGARLGWTGQCLCLHCCCFMFMIFLRMIAVTGDPPVCLGEIILTWHRYSVCCISVWGVRTEDCVTARSSEPLIMMCIEGSELIIRY